MSERSFTYNLLVFSTMTFGDCISRRMSSSVTVFNKYNHTSALGLQPDHGLVRSVVVHQPIAVQYFIQE